jgi:type IV secretion system protein TrbD
MSRLTEDHHTDIEIVPCPIHRSLIRPILLAGAERTLVLINLTCIVMLIFGVGLHWLTAVLALFFALIGHAVLMRLSHYDPNFSRVYLRHIRYQDFYPAQGSVLSKGWYKNERLS